MHHEWNVCPVIPIDLEFNNFIRFTISLADFRVKDNIKIRDGCTPCSTKYNARDIIVFVLPVPAPARTNKCLPSKQTAFFCSSLRFDNASENKFIAFLSFIDA